MDSAQTREHGRAALVTLRLYALRLGWGEQMGGEGQLSFNGLTLLVHL